MDRNQRERWPLSLSKGRRSETESRPARVTFDVGEEEVPGHQKPECAAAAHVCRRPMPFGITLDAAAAAAALPYRALALGPLQSAPAPGL